MSDLSIPGRAKKRNDQIDHELFYVTLMVNGKAYAIAAPIQSPNQESLAAVMSAIVAANLPQVTGFELYRHNPEYEQNRQFLMHCPVMEIMMSLQPVIQKAAGAQVMRSAVPVLGGKENGENLQQMFDELKKAGKQVV